MLTLTLDGQPVDLPADAAVALSFRSSDLRRLDTREAAFSETFALPLTARNARVLGAPHVLDSQTSSPYRKLPAVLSFNDVPVLTGAAVLEASELGYEVTLLDDTADLFGRIGNANLRELNLSDLDHPRTLPAIQAASTDNPARGYVYGLADTGRLAFAGTDARVAAYEQPASVYEATLLTRIVAKALPGFALTGTLLADPLFASAVLPAVLSMPRLREAYLAPYRVQVGTNTDRVYAVPAGGATPQALDLEFPIVGTGSAAHFTLNKLYTPPAHNAQVEIHGRLLVKNDGFKKYLDLHGANQTGQLAHLFRQEIPGRIFAERNIAFVVSFSITLPAYLLATYGPLTLRVTDFDNGSAVPSGDQFIRLTVLAGSSVTFAVAPLALSGAPVHLETTLPDLSQADYLKLLANRFNTTFAVDAAAKTVRFDLFNELERRRADAVDWTRKLDYSQRPRLDYRLPDFAQQNIFRYKDAPEAYAPVFGSLSIAAAAAQVGQAALLVPDTTLAKTADTFTAPVILPALCDVCGGRARVVWLPTTPIPDPADPRYATAWTFGAAYRTGDRVTYVGRTWTCTRAGYGIPTSYPNNLVNNSDWAADTPGDTDAPAVAALFPLPAGPPLLSDDQLDATTPASYPAVVGLTRAGLSFTELFAAYHQGTARILSRVQLVTAYFTLHASDIVALDFSRPVYLDAHWLAGYGELTGYFYLNLIDQYQPQRPGAVRCELLRLGEPVSGLAPAALPLPHRAGRALLAETGFPLHAEPDATALTLVQES